jgi:hypothetical protein
VTKQSLVTRKDNARGCRRAGDGEVEFGAASAGVDADCTGRMTSESDKMRRPAVGAAGQSSIARPRLELPLNLQLRVRERTMLVW